MRRNKKKTNAGDDGEPIEVAITSSEEDETSPVETAPDEPVPNESEPDELVEELSETEQLRRRVVELEDKLLRHAAEFDNYRKRKARQFEDATNAASQDLLRQFLEIVDNFERALNAPDNGENDVSFRQGTEMILGQMMDLLARYEVSAIESLGESFNPELHEAIMRVSSDEYEEGTVAVEISKGYRRRGAVLRHARVGVSMGPTEKKSPAEDSAE